MVSPHFNPNRPVSTRGILQFDRILFRSAILKINVVFSNASLSIFLLSKRK